ncbi:MAG: hypothetical protein FWG73_00725 [Planctomycetaceae bacterium]|nr:hypothetical protein [Planctomycetaceae bacterium]
MILEQNIPYFTDWIAPAVLAWFVAVSVLLAVALSIGAIIALIWYGPARFRAPFTEAVTRGVANAFISPQRTWAIALLTIKESIRRRVLLIFAMFLLLVLMAGWFLDPASDDPARLYLSFVTGATTILVLLLALFLSAFSLPTDIKSKTIYTVVTKPVRSSELVLGRIVGISLVGTLILVLMGGASYLFVSTGLQHSHLLSEREDLTPVSLDSGDHIVESQRVVFRGETQLSNGHKHPVTVFADGRIYVEPVNGHTHHVTTDLRTDGQTRYTVHESQGALQARIPIYAQTLNFRKSDGLEESVGINVGDEWEYRSYISGPSDGAASEAAIFSFDGVREYRFSPDVLAAGIPIEVTMGVFRTHKGDIEQRVRGRLAIRNPQTGLRVDVVTFSTEEFITFRLLIPRTIEGTPLIVQRQGRNPDGTAFISPSNEVAESGRNDLQLTQRRQFDLFEDFVADGQIEIWLHCEDRGQYVGVARHDLYIRAADASVAMNFVKGYYKIWMQMMILISFGVLFSTFLSGPVAMLSTVGVLIAGFAKSFVIELGFNRVLGGGPFESFYRLLIQQNMVVDLEMGLATQFIKASDVVYSKFLLLIGQAVPPLSEYAVYDIALVSGFNIPANWVVIHTITTLAYAVPLFIVAYLILSNREVAK